MRLLALTLVLVAAPGVRLDAQATGRTCSLDSASYARFAGTGRLRDCDVDRPATLRTPPDPVYRLTREKPCVTVTLEFVVDSLGRVDSTTMMVVETDDLRFAEAVIKTLPRWRYEPAVLRGKQVSQIVRERRRKSLGYTVGAREPLQPPPDARCG